MYPLVIMSVIASIVLVLYYRQNKLYQEMIATVKEDTLFIESISTSHADLNRVNRHNMTQLSSEADETAEVTNVIVPVSAVNSSNDTFVCKTASIMNMALPICLYTEGVDDTISGLMLRGTYFEGSQISRFLRMLLQDRRLQMVDIGANVGLWSLPAARVSQVIAVEPNWNSMLRLATAVHLGTVSSNITLLHNAVSDVRTTFTMGVHPNNQGNAFLIKTAKCKATPNGLPCITLPETKTILMNDILPLMRSKSALLKVDAEGHEVNIFTELTAGQFFGHIDVPLVYMEWVLAKKHPVAIVQRLLNFFYSRKYSALSLTNSKLENYYLHWPDDIVFKKMS